MMNNTHVKNKIKLNSGRSIKNTKSSEIVLFSVAVKMMRLFFFALHGKKPRVEKVERLV